MLDINKYNATYADIAFRIGNSEKEIINKHIQCNTKLRANEFYSITKLDCPSENEKWSEFAKNFGQSTYVYPLFGKDNNGEYADYTMYKLYKVSDDVGEYAKIRINGSSGSLSVVSIIIIVAIVCIIIIVFAIVFVSHKKQSSAKLPKKQVTEKPIQTVSIQNTATTEQVANNPISTPATVQL